MHSVYHILARQPALYKEDMYVETEELALQLVLMGRLRIDADEQRNFVRFACPFREVSLAFSNRELTDPMLVDRTEDILTTAFAEGNTRKESPREQAKDAIELLRNEAKKNFLLSLEDEMKIARILVQCAEPAVIMLMIAEGTEIFVTYGAMVGDAMDIASWKIFGLNSGLQSTDGKHGAVFVSCGGNPLLIPDEENQPTYESDGYGALARMMIVAGQEIGHYSDIIRDERGHHVARHSSNISVTHATTKAAKARKHDAATVKKLSKILDECGIQKVASAEAGMRFFKRHGRWGPLVWFSAIRTWMLTQFLKYRCNKAKIHPWRYLPNQLHIGSQLLLALEDMYFQLVPDVEAYRDENPAVEEAVMCAEALARVPQQVIKWGHPMTQLCMHDLYQLYYTEVIPECEREYQRLTGSQFKMALHKPRRSLITWFKTHFIQKRKRHAPLPYFSRG